MQILEQQHTCPLQDNELLFAVQKKALDLGSDVILAYNMNEHQTIFVVMLRNLIFIVACKF